MRFIYSLIIVLLMLAGCGELSDWQMDTAIPVTPTVSAAKATNTVNLLIDTLNREDLVGMQLAVAPLSGEIWTVSVGTAGLDRKKPVTDNSLFRIGSLTKPYTATAILRLVESGQINLDEPVSSYLPGYEKSSRFTVEQLLNHQSGIVDIFSIPDIFTTSTWFPDKFWNHKELVRECLSRNLQFTPGTKTEYSNANYILLGLLAEKVSGKPITELYKEFTSDTWFIPYESRPAGMVNGHVDNYITMGRWYEVKPDNTSWGSAAFSAGALVSNASNIIRFGQQLFSADLFNPTLLSRMTNTIRGKGLGVISYTPGETGLLGHEGEITGYTAALLFDAESQLLYAVCCNTTPFDTVAFLDRVRKVVSP